MGVDVELKAKGYTPSRAPEELGSLLGGLLTADWVQGMIARGHGYHVSIGAFSTPIVGGGNGDVLDQDQPEGIVSVGTGWCCVPFRIHVQVQTPLLATDADESEILIAVDRAAAWAGDGTVVREQQFNLRTDKGAGFGPLDCASAATGNITNPTLAIELAHSVVVGDVQTAVGTTLTKHELLYEPKNPPYIVGPAALYLYWGGTVATSGFAQASYLAFPSGLLTSLV